MKKYNNKKLIKFKTQIQMKKCIVNIEQNKLYNRII